MKVLLQQFSLVDLCSIKHKWKIVMAVVIGAAATVQSAMVVIAVVQDQFDRIYATKQA